MSARDDAIREADRVIARTGYLPIERMAAAVVDAVAPIIRADERDAWVAQVRKVHEEWQEELNRREAEVRADERRQVVLDHESGIVYRDLIEAEVRERIAQEIEAACRMQCVRGDDCSHEQDARIARARADERERMTLPEWAQVVADARASAEADLRERIAQEIEDKADDWADWDAIAKTEGDMFAIRDLVQDALHDAARIARGHIERDATEAEFRERQRAQVEALRDEAQRTFEQYARIARESK